MSDSPAVILFDTSAVEKGTEGNPVRVDGTGTTPQPVSGDFYTDYDPNPLSIHDGTTENLSVDSEQHLRARAQVLTDEGSFRDDFPGTSLVDPLTGTLSFTNNQKTVTGLGTSFTTELDSNHLVKPDSAGDQYWSSIGRVISDTELELEEPYAGPTALGAASSATHWETSVVGSASYSVLNSELVLATGTVSGNKATIYRFADYGPLILSIHAKVSQRIANQELSLKFCSDPTSPFCGAGILFSGTDDRKVKLVTRSSSSAYDVEITEVSVPSAGRTDSYHYYEIDLSGKTVVLSVDGEAVATHRRHIPGPYAPLYVTVDAENTGTAASSTSLYVDGVYLQSMNAVEVGSSLNTDPMNVLISGSTSPITVSIGTETPVNPSLIYTAKLRNGGSSNMLVNGSVTPVPFVVNADPTIDIALTELRLTLCAGSIIFDGTKFAGIPALTNGLLVDMQVNGGDLATLANVQINENLFEFASTAGINVLTEFSGTNDLLVTSFALGGSMRLRAGTTDYIRIQVRDDLTATTNKYFQAVLYGVKV